MNVSDERNIRSSQEAARHEKAMGWEYDSHNGMTILLPALMSKEYHVTRQRDFHMRLDILSALC